MLHFIFLCIQSDEFFIACSSIFKDGPDFVFVVFQFNGVGTKALIALLYCFLFETNFLLKAFNAIGLLMKENVLFIKGARFLFQQFGLSGQLVSKLLHPFIKLLEFMENRLRLGQKLIQFL